MAGLTQYDTDIRSYAPRLTNKSRRKIELLIEDLNREISAMPLALRNPFRIVRDLAIEMLDE